MIPRVTVVFPHPLWVLAITTRGIGIMRLLRPDESSPVYAEIYRRFSGPVGIVHE